MVTIKTFTDPHKEKQDARNERNEKLTEPDLKVEGNGPVVPPEKPKANPTDKAEADPVDDPKAEPTDKPVVDPEKPATPAVDKPDEPPADLPGEAADSEKKPADEKDGDDPVVPDEKPNEQPADEQTADEPK